MQFAVLYNCISYVLLLSYHQMYERIRVSLHVFNYHITHTHKHYCSAVTFILRGTTNAFFGSFTNSASDNIIGDCNKSLHFGPPLNGGRYFKYSATPQSDTGATS